MSTFSDCIKSGDILTALNLGREYSYENSDEEWVLKATAKNYIENTLMPSENPMVGYVILCAAAAGQGQAKMTAAYDEYEDTADAYKEANSYAQEAAEQQQAAADSGNSTAMSSGLIAYCDENDIGYSTKGGDYKHDEDQWQTLRDGLDSQKSITSTDMKMAGAEFDQAAKDADSAQQLAADGVSKAVDVFSTLGKSI